MDGEVLGSTEAMETCVGEGTGVVVLGEGFGFVVLRCGVQSGLGEISFIDDGGAERGVIEGPNGKEATSGICFDMEVAVTLWDSVRTICSREKFEGTWVGRGESHIMVKEMVVAGA